MDFSKRKLVIRDVVIFTNGVDDHGLLCNQIPMNFECPFVMIEGLPYPFPFHYFEFKLDVAIENYLEKKQQGF